VLSLWRERDQDLHRGAGRDRLIMLVASVFEQPGYPQATGIFPQVVSCVPEHPPQRHTGPDWQPTLKVTVEPGRDPGRVREYRVLGCSLYYYHQHF
jgi:hypothetical protein